jgi:hypothetical protein
MSTTNTSIYMEHPLVRAYLRDLDVALGDVSGREAGEIRQSIREHLVSEFTLRQVSDDASVGAIVKETLDKLGPVESIISGLTGEDEADIARRTSRRTIAVIAVTAVSVVLTPFAVGVSAILSVIALVVAVKWVSARARTVLIVVNAIELVVALVYLIFALTTAGALFETVQVTS